MYVRDVKAGVCNTEGEPSIIKDSIATAYVDGNNLLGFKTTRLLRKKICLILILIKCLLGPAVGNFCMNLAIQKAKQAGIGMVVAKRSNHYGIAGYYSMQALKENMIVIYLLSMKVYFKKFNIYISLERE